MNTITINSLSKGKIWKHNRTRELYIIEESHLFKHPITQEWERSIDYVSMETNEKYGRMEYDFLNNFTLV